MFQFKMKNPARFIGIGVMVLLIVGIISSVGPVSSSKAVYTIDRSSLHSYGSSDGCDASEKSNFTLNGTKGQPEVWPELSDSKLNLQGGFGANRHVPSNLDCDATAVPTASPIPPSPTETPDPTDPTETPVPPVGTPVPETSIFLPVIQR